MTKGRTSVAKKVLYSALSAAMIVAFAPAIGVVAGSGDGVAYAAEGEESGDSETSSVDIVNATTLRNAIESAKDGDTLTLKHNIVLQPSDNSTSAAISITKNVTIMMNGHSITGQGTRVFSVEKGKLNLDGHGSISATGTENSAFPDNSSVIRVGSNNGEDSSKADASCTIGEEVQVSTDYCWGISVFGSKTNENLEVYGSITATGKQGCISGNGGKDYGGTSITLYDGATLNSEKEIAIYHPQQGNLVLHNAKITGTGGIEMKAGTLAIAAGANPTITATGQKKHEANGSGNSTDGYALSVVGNSGYAGPATAYLTGGTFNGSLTAVDDNDPAVNHGTIEVFAGTFSEDPTAFLPAKNNGDYKVTATSDGKHIVSLDAAKAAVEVIDENGQSQQYGSIADAFAKVASENAEVKLLKNIALGDGETITISGNSPSSLNLNGKTITGKVNGGNGAQASGGIFFVESGSLEVKGAGTIENTATGRAPVFSVNSKARLYINNGKYITAGYGLLDCFGNTNINNGSFVGKHAEASGEKSTFYVNGGSLYFEHGSLDASAGTYGIYAKNDGDLVLGDSIDYSGPSIKSYWPSVAGNNQQGKCTFTIHGGTYTAGHASDKDAIEDKENSVLFLPAEGDSEIFGGTFKTAYKNTAVICIPYRNAGVDLNIYGGTFDASAGDVIFRSYKNANYTGNVESFCTITGGAFKGSIARFSEGNTYDQFICGGTFDTLPDINYIGEGYSANYVNGAYTVAKTGHVHKYGNPIITTPATCTTPGIKSWTCVGDDGNDGCGTVKTEAIPALGHRFTTGDINWTNGGVSAATATFTCAHNSSHKQVVTASISKKLTTKPTCTVKGVNTYTATATSSTGTTISSSKTVQDEPALGHAFGPYTVTVQPTTYSTGLATAKCTRTGCAKTETKTIEKLKSTQTAMAGYSSVGVTVVDAKPTTTPNGTHVVGTVSIDSISSLATKAEIPETVTIKGAEYAVTSISAKAFAGNAKITSASIPETVASLPTGLFKGCSSLATVKLPSKITEIPADTFNGTAIANIVFPSTVTKIGNRAFKGTELTNISLPCNLSSLGKDAFKDCKKLTGVTLPADFKSIPAGAFSGCSALKSIAPTGGFKALDVAGTTAPTTVDISKVTTIGANAFKGCKSVTTVNASKATTIGTGAFSGTTRLKGLKSGTGLKSIGKSALSGNKKLKTLELKTKKLTKSGVKSSLKGSAVKTVSVRVAGSKKTKAKYVAVYKKIFTAKNSGKKVNVK